MKRISEIFQLRKGVNQIMTKKGMALLSYNFQTDEGASDFVYHDFNTGELVFLLVVQNWNKKFEPNKDFLPVCSRRRIYNVVKWYIKKYNREEFNWRVDCVEAYLVNGRVVSRWKKNIINKKMADEHEANEKRKLEESSKNL